MQGVTGGKSLIELPDLQGFVFVDNQVPVYVIVACGSISSAMKITVSGPANAAHGKTFGDLVFFQLGEDGEDSDHGAAKGGRGVKIFVDGDKIDVISEEFVFDEHEGVLLASGQTVQFVDDHSVDDSSRDVSEHLLETGAVYIASRVASVSIEFYDGNVFGLTIGCQPFGLFLDAVVL